MEMDWASALWADIVRHAGAFEVSPPRTVDQLMAWIGLFALLIAAFKILKKRFREALEDIRPTAKFRNTALTIHSLRTNLQTAVNSGAGDVRVAGLRNTAEAFDILTLILISLVIIGIATALGTEATWGAIGLMTALAAISWSISSDYYAMIKLVLGNAPLAGKSARYAMHIQRAETYLAVDPPLQFDDRFTKKSLDRMREDLPKVKALLAELRARRPN